MAAPRVHIYGIRHHGPGSARALQVALSALTPDLVLIEGPADAGAALEQLGAGEFVPPVAMLVYRVEQPSQAVFYPFMEWSPEWQALQYARAQQVPARWIDLPFGQSFPGDLPETASEDPLEQLAEIAGFDDREQWWEQQFELYPRQRALSPADAEDFFAAVYAVMDAARQAAPPVSGYSARREAAMRQAIRVAEQEGYTRIAVVVGAWHGPLLSDAARAAYRAQDRRLLQGGRKTKTKVTWVPWTAARLAARSGYGAGVTSPGWYQQLWDDPATAVQRWVALAAALFRADGQDISTAQVLDAVRLAEGLAALRDLRHPGLPELQDALMAVLCGGESLPMRLIRERLEVGGAIGHVPEGLTEVPLAAEVSRRARALRLALTATPTPLRLDLREERAREKSRFLHQLHLLGVPWGRVVPASGQGTWKEHWELIWQPDFSLRIIDASLFGNTPEAAAAGRLSWLAARTTALPALVQLLDDAILAALPPFAVLERIQATAALLSDLLPLLQAFPTLVRIRRYGDVRATPTEVLGPVITTLGERICAGLPAAARQGGTVGQVLFGVLPQVHPSICLEPSLRLDWLAALERLLSAPAVDGRLRGLSARLLLQEGALSGDALERLVEQAFSPASPPIEAANWLEGLLSGAEATVLTIENLWAVLDRWLVSLPAERFLWVLPILRRAFSGVPDASRQRLSQQVRRLGVPPPPPLPLDPERAARVLPLLGLLLRGRDG